MRLHQRALPLILLVLCLLVLAPLGFGQTDAATLSGLITDPQGMVVPDVAVEVTNVETNVSVHQATNSAGLYVVIGLKPGRYRVSVTKEGFRRIDLTDLVLNVQDVLSRNFQLQLGPVMASITVVADGAKINTTDASVSTVIDRNFVENLPLNGRTFNTLIQLTPGTVTAPSSRAAPGQFSINGQRTNTNSFQVDGASANFGVDASIGLTQSGGGGVPAFGAFGSTSSLVSVDAVQEFRVQTSSFAPEYGRNPGGQVAIETRSGTNRLHGTIFEYFRNETLDANNWFANHAGEPRAAERQNDFGGVLGGPIVKNRTFFFFSYEGLRLRQPHVQTYTVPSLMAREAAIPAAAPYLNAFPLPNDPADPLNPWVAPFTGSFSDPQTLNATSLRIDQTVSAKLALFARYNYAPSEIRSRVNLGNSVFSQPFRTHTGTLGLTWIPGSVLSNSLRFNYSVQQAKGQFTVTDFGGAVVPPATALIPPPASLSGSNASFAPPDTSPFDFGSTSHNRESQINVVDTVAWTIGVHQVKFGVDFRQLHLEQADLDLSALYFPFSTQDFANTANAFVIGIANRPGALKIRQYSLYGQDTWKIMDRLTLTYGLRWDINPAPSPDDGTVLASWRNVATPATMQLAPTGTAVWETKFGNVSPRIGGAYRLTEKGDLVFRVGWGIFYDTGTGGSAGLLTFFPNRSLRSTVQTLPVSDASAITAPFSSSPPFTDTLISGFDPNLDLPRLQQWNVAMEKSFGNSHALSLTYIGQRGSHLLRNQITRQPNSDFAPFSLFQLTTNGDVSNYQALQAQFRRNMSNGLQFLASYTWSHSIDTGSDDSFLVNSDSVIPAGEDRGSSAFDVRHNFSGAIAYEIPKLDTNRVLSALVNGWSLYSVVQARSGLPIDVRIIGIPIPGAVTTTRPDLVPNTPVWISDPNAPAGQVLNSAAFAAPPTPRQGNLPRNSIKGFGASQLDFSVARRFTISEPVSLQFRADIFNLFNHPNFANPLGLLFLGSFIGGGGSTQMLNDGLSQNGQGLNALYQMGGPRSVQFSLKLSF